MNLTTRAVMKLVKDRSKSDLKNPLRRPRSHLLATAFPSPHDGPPPYRTPPQISPLPSPKAEQSKNCSLTGAQRSRIPRKTLSTVASARTPGRRRREPGEE